jgi:hypothetical protein
MTSRVTIRDAPWAWGGENLTTQKRRGTIQCLETVFLSVVGEYARLHFVPRMPHIKFDPKHEQSTQHLMLAAVSYGIGADRLYRRVLVFDVPT